MRKTIFIILFITFSRFLFSQSTDKDSLACYSYILQGFNNGKFSNRGTGFIIHYLDKYYLVSNYHVFTGKDPETGQMTPNTRDTNTSVIVNFINKKNDGFVRTLYPLFDKTQSPLFYTYHFVNDGMLDVAILPIALPTNVTMCSIEIGNVDTSFTCDPTSKISIVGFPAYSGKRFGEVKISNTFTVNKENDFYLHYSDTTMHGMSGSPIYLEKLNQPAILLAINKGYDKLSNNGNAIYIGYALRIIRGVYKIGIPSVWGEEYPLTK